jgi:hypothetical protein
MDRVPAACPKLCAEGVGPVSSRPSFLLGLGGLRHGSSPSFAVIGWSAGRSRRLLPDHEVDHQFPHGLDHLTAVRRAAPRGLGCRSTQTAPLSWAAATDGAAYERRRRWALADRR